MQLRGWLGQCLWRQPAKLNKSRRLGRGLGMNETKAILLEWKRQGFKRIQNAELGRGIAVKSWSVHQQVIFSITLRRVLIFQTQLKIAFLFWFCFV